MIALCDDEDYDVHPFFVLKRHDDDDDGIQEHHGLSVGIEVIGSPEYSSGHPLLSRLFL